MPHAKVKNKHKLKVKGFIYIYFVSARTKKRIKLMHAKLVVFLYQQKCIFVISWRLLQLACK